MIKTIYGRAFAVCMKKPLRFWGISLLASLFAFLIEVLFGIVPGIALSLNILLSVGATMVYLHGYRGEQVETLQLFDAFKDGATVKRTLGGMAWMYLWIFVWGLIPIVGPIFAIIRKYEYRLTPYILVQEPEIKATDAIKVSKERTNGWKAKMFWADILPGIIVCGAVLLLALLAMIPYIGVLFGIVDVLLVIAALLCMPFFLGLVKAAFYEEITNPTIPAKAAVKYCPVCGTQISKDAVFCPKCGKKLVEEAAPAAPEAVEVPETAEAPETVETPAEEAAQEEVKAEE